MKGLTGFRNDERPVSGLDPDSGGRRICGSDPVRSGAAPTVGTTCRPVRLRCRDAMHRVSTDRVNKADPGYVRSYPKISITFFMITLSKIFSRYHSPKVFIFVTACKRSAVCGRRVSPLFRRSRPAVMKIRLFKPPKRNVYFLTAIKR
jgi:hypothetical protein